jgi:hypothetical protein
MPPSNTSFGAATDLGSTLPIDNTQSDINDTGVNYTVYYKFTCPASLVMVWAWATSDNSSGYRPKLTPYDQSQVEILVESSYAPLLNNPIQFPVTPGQVHYLKAVKNVDSAGPEHIDLQIRAVPTASSIPNGAIIVNGDIIGQPCGIHSGTADYTTIEFISGVVVGESIDISSTRRVLANNKISSDKKLVLYDATSNMSVLGTDATMLAYSYHRYNRSTGYFWVLVNENAAYSKLYKINPAILPLAKTLVATVTGAGNGRGISTNNDETIAYYYANIGAYGAAVKRWNLTTDTAMTDLASGEPLMVFLDSLVLEDNTVIVCWSDVSAAGTVRVKRYNSSGSVLNTYEFESYELSYGIARLAYALDSPAHFWVKLRERSGSTPTGDAMFKKINVATGDTTTTIRQLEYADRDYIGPASATYRGESGSWNSCGFAIYGTPGPSGIYIITQDKRYDSLNTGDVAIPTPTFRTSLLP